jgi:flagellar biosynthesis/type III secretory pathway protein FliH
LEPQYCGRKEGREGEGREGGRKEGRKEGREEGRKEGRRLSIEYRSTKTNGTCLLSKFTRIPSHSYLVEIHLEPASSNFS